MLKILTQGWNKDTLDFNTANQLLERALMSDNANGHAWIRDNVYSILSVWALSMAYKKYRSIFIKPDFSSIRKKNEQKILSQIVLGYYQKP